MERSDATTAIRRLRRSMQINRASRRIDAAAAAAFRRQQRRQRLVASLRLAHFAPLHCLRTRPTLCRLPLAISQTASRLKNRGISMAFNSWVALREQGLFLRKVRACTPDAPHPANAPRHHWTAF